MTTAKKFLYLASIVALITPLAARADTVTIQLVNGSSSPYKFTVDDITTSTITNNVFLSCLSDSLHVSTNETWYVNVENLWTSIIDPGGHMASSTSTVSGLSGGLTVGDLEGDAYLDTLYGTGFDGTDNQDIQNAMWDVLNPSAVNLGGPNTPASKVYALAEAIVGQSTTETSAFYSQFTFYVPTSEQNGDWGNNGQPQPFLGYIPTETPEPSSLLLLGTGMAGLAWIVRRRMLAARV
ncbi:MAG: PEP-CTERM sorting domain-containing protein [Acidobacteriaceae bacterium]|jgi:hypothetical protein